MSQASKQVDWCLKKAEKEIEKCKKLGKSPKHRGLLKIIPNLELAKEHIEKAEHNLKVAQYLKEGNFSDSSIGTIFYAMYRCFLSIAAKFGYDSSNQTCTISLIEHLNEKGKINLDAKFIDLFKYKEDGRAEKDSVIELREEYTYGTEIKANEEKINELIQLAKELIDYTKEMILSQKNK